MIILYIVFIVLFIGISIYMIDLCQRTDQHKYLIKTKKEEIEQLNKNLDNIIENLDKTQNAIVKVDNISKKILKFRK